MSDLDALLDAAVERKTSDPEIATAVVEVGGESLTFRFTEMDSREWAGHTIRALPRPNIDLDRYFGFNVTAAAESAAPYSAVLVEGDEDRKLTAEQWAKLFTVMDSAGRSSVQDAVIAVNEGAALRRLEEAKKALTRGRKRKPDSPAS